MHFSPFRTYSILLRYILGMLFLCLYDIKIIHHSCLARDIYGASM